MSLSPNAYLLGLHNAKTTNYTMSGFNDIIKTPSRHSSTSSPPVVRPCKMQGPILEQVKAIFGDSVNIIKIDVDRNPRAISHLPHRSVHAHPLRQQRSLYTGYGLHQADRKRKQSSANSSAGAVISSTRNDQRRCVGSTRASRTAAFCRIWFFSVGSARKASMSLGRPREGTSSADRL